MRVITDDTLAAQRSLIEPPPSRRQRLDFAAAGMVEVAEYALRLGPEAGWAAIREVLRPWFVPQSAHGEVWS